MEHENQERTSLGAARDYVAGAVDQIRERTASMRQAAVNLVFDAFERRARQALIDNRAKFLRGKGHGDQLVLRVVGPTEADVREVYEALANERFRGIELGRQQQIFEHQMVEEARKQKAEQEAKAAAEKAARARKRKKARR